MHKNKKLSGLPNGYYFVEQAEDEKGNVLRNIMIQKTGGQISYFGTEYYDRAKDITGNFIPIIPKRFIDEADK